jgi:hypothetical protein
MIKMKITESSLHYKFNKFWADGDQMPTTLCGYFWFTLFNLLIRSFVSCTTLIAGILFLLTPLLRLFTTSEIVHDSGTAALYLYSIIAVVLMGGLFFNKSSFGRIVAEYIKTLKTRICPIVEYEGEKK